MYQKGIEAIEKAGVDAVIISSPANMRYLSGFTGEGYVYLAKDRRAVVTDFRYVFSARKECENFDIIDMKKESYGVIRGYISDSVKKIGFEGNIVTFSEYGKMREMLPEVEFENIEGVFTLLRSIKCEDEIEKICKAEAIGDLAFSGILQELRSGMTEREVAAKLEQYMKEAGAEGISFDTIAAAGIHSSMPHAVPTDKRLEDGDFLTMDFGCKYQGYCSDMTRTVVIGHADQKQKEIYQVVLNAQLKALRQIRPGITGKEVDAIAREVIEDAGYGNCFGHGLGHSVGLEIHESPAFSARDDHIIQPGMVITVEPGIYLDGFYGVRIEDVVVITEDGCRNITHSEKELMEICR